MSCETSEVWWSTDVQHWATSLGMWNDKCVVRKAEWPSWATGLWEFFPAVAHSPWCTFTLTVSFCIASRWPCLQGTFPCGNTMVNPVSLGIGSYSMHDGNHLWQHFLWWKNMTHCATCWNPYIMCAACASHYCQCYPPPMSSTSSRHTQYFDTSPYTWNKGQSGS